MLEEFGINNILLKNRKEKDSFRIRLMIYADSKNLIRFFSKINYEYCKEKRKLSNASIVWLKQKEKILEFRENILIKAREMKSQGFQKSEIIEKLSCKYANKYFIDKGMYYSNYAKTGTRIAYCFISFNEFVAKNCFGEEGFIWDRLNSKIEKKYEDFVYDFTIKNENHNFISNGYVVSNCSVRLLKTNLTKKEILDNQKKIANELDRKIPSGLGRGSSFQVSKNDFKEILEIGAKWMVDKGYGKKEDYENVEEEGCLKGADFEKVSERAVKRGIGELGTLGSGNHFLEVLFVDEIFEEKTAKAFGLEKEQAVILIHCGSRGLGHQIASDYIKKMSDKYGFENLPDRQLICAPIKSELGKDYYSAMACATNFAFANKQLITHWVREEMKHIFPDVKIDVVYDVSHNIAKFEKHIINGKEKEICVHRKGATRAFGKGRKEVPKKYRKFGQPVLIPGSMGTASYVLVGTKKAEELTFGSTVHGAGRVMSRSQAMKNYKYEDIVKNLESKGIIVKSKSEKSLKQENSEVYKDIEEVANVVDSLGISKKVTRLKPLVVIIG